MVGFRGGQPWRKAKAILVLEPESSPPTVATHVQAVSNAFVGRRLECGTENIGFTCDTGWSCTLSRVLGLLSSAQVRGGMALHMHRGCGIVSRAKRPLMQVSERSGRSDGLGESQIFADAMLLITLENESDG